MKLLVGIPTHKRPELLRKCLDSIAAQRGELPEIEVFVADNDAVGRQGMKLVAELGPQYRFPLHGATVEEPGISAVRNTILDEARDRGVDFIAMIDDDETASPEWLMNLLAMQKSTAADVVGGPVQFEFSSNPDPLIVGSKTFQTPIRPAGITWALWGTGNFLAATTSLSRTNWPMFDNDFGLSGGEDREWFLRIERLGLTFAWAPGATTTEDVPAERATEKWILQRAYRCGNCDMRVAMQDWPSRDLFRKIGRIALTVGSAPILAPLLFVKQRRLWLLRIWSRAAGETAAILGRHYQEYSERHASNTDLAT